MYLPHALKSVVLLQYISVEERDRGIPDIYLLLIIINMIWRLNGPWDWAS